MSMRLPWKAPKHPVQPLDDILRTTQLGEQHVPMLPVELWVLLLETVSPRDRLALARSCRALFLLVNTHAPFRVLKLSALDEASARELCKLPSLLTFAAKIEWIAPHSPGSLRNLIKAAADPVSNNDQAFCTILSPIVHSSSLRHLSLAYLDVTKQHQCIIFGLPNLRTLSLRSAHMMDTNPASCIAIPCITELRLRASLRPEPTLGLLSLLKDSIQTLELDIYACASSIYPGLSELELPQLTTLKQTSVPSEVHPRLASFLRHNPTIQFLDYFHPPYSSDLSFTDPQLLPNLRRLVSFPDAAAQFMNGRHIQEFWQHSLCFPLERAQGLRLLFALSNCDPPLKTLYISVRSYVHGFFYSIAEHLPKLVRLVVRIPDGGGQWDLSGSRRSYSYLENLWDTSRRRVTRKPFEGLKQIRVAFTRPLKEDVFPLRTCTSIFEHGIIHSSPVLDTVEFVALDSPGDFETEDIPHNWRLKFCRTWDGPWERRRFMPACGDKTE